MCQGGGHNCHSGIPRCLHHPQPGRVSAPFSMDAAQFRSILLIRAVMISMGSSLGSKGGNVSSWVTVASQPERVTISSYQYYTSTSLNHHYKSPVSCDYGSEQPLSPPFPRTEFNTNTVYHSYRLQASLRVKVSDRQNTPNLRVLYIPRYFYGHHEFQLTRSRYCSCGTGTRPFILESITVP